MKKILKIASAVPALKVADVDFNTQEIIRCAEKALEAGAELIVFPHLAVTGSTCGDLFQYSLLQDAAENALKLIAETFKNTDLTLIMGAFPDRAAVICKGGIRYCRNGEKVDAFHLSVGGCVCEKSPAIVLAAIPAVAGQARKIRERFLRSGATAVFVSAGIGESTTDAVYGGQALIVQDGKLLAENRMYCSESRVIVAEINTENSEKILQDVEETEDTTCATPFLTGDEEEAFLIQQTGLAQRLRCSRTEKIVLGVSGGLDSTLALLVAAETLKSMDLPASNLIAVTMPGFGTTGRTKSNSEKMAELLGCDLRKIDITKACLQHFEDIGHDKNVLDVTYENVQARERTQILMDVANRERALVLGTGDLSEIALGWCTYNADHISMYNVNCSVPKTLIRTIVKYYADHCGGALAQVLTDVLNTPVSPELLPPGADGEILQSTETILGSYELHDFYLYRFIVKKESPSVIREKAMTAFQGKYPPEEIARTVKLFFRRFFTQQFKRSCSADGPQVTAVSLSPRGSWQMPSDAAMTLWLNDLESE